MLSNRGLECKKKRNHKRIDTVIKIMLDALVAFYRTSIFYFIGEQLKKIMEKCFVDTSPLLSIYGIDYFNCMF
jgi:hypothetical protein